MVSKLMNVRVSYQVFIAPWKRLATCFVDTTENRPGLLITYQKGNNNNGIDSTFFVYLVLTKAVCCQYIDL